VCAYRNGSPVELRRRLGIEAISAFQGAVPSESPQRISKAVRRAASVARRPDPSSHSHTIITRQPFAFRSSVDCVSRAMFRSNFSTQNSVLLFGVVAILHPLCRCQKHPWTKITVLYRVSTISGLPGRSLRCSLNRKPSACNARRSATSGEVFEERIRDMRFDRSDGLRKSIKVPSYRLPADCALSNS
jgi:hypothetical protein